MHRIVSNRRRALLTAAVAPLALLAAACGGSTATGGVGAAGTDGKAATAFPASSLVYVDANVDMQSDAWKKADTLLSRFPSWAKTKADFLSGAADSGNLPGHSFARDIQPWLGSEAGVAITGVSLSGASGTHPTFVAYVESKDDAKLEAELVQNKGTKTGSYKGYDLLSDTSGSDTTYAAVGKGALLVSNDATALRGSVDLLEGTGDSLAKSDSFTSAMGKLPKDNLLVGYVNGTATSQLLRLAMQSGLPGASTAGSTAQSLKELTAIRWASFSLGAEDNGLRLHGAANADQSQLGVSQGTFSPDLGKRVPGNAYLYLELQGLGKGLSQALQQQPGSSAQLGQLQSATGLSLVNDIEPLLAGETAVYLAPGLPASVGLLLHPADAASGAATMAKLVSAIVKLSPSTTITPLGSGEEGAKATLSGQTIIWRRDGDVIGIGNDPSVGKEQSPSIQDSDTYKRVSSEAGVPGKVSFLAFADVPSLVGLAKTAGGSTDAEQQANLARLGGLIVYGTQSGDDSSADAFLEVR
jgi:hypothetical protein